MKKSPVYPRYEANDYDLHAEFSQFLEEAKQKETKTEDDQIMRSKQDQDQDKKKKKKKKKKAYWKAFVLPWWRVEKKKTKNDPGKRISGFTSGPVYGGDGITRQQQQPQRALSGPLMSSLFSPMRKAGVAETPYVCLDHRRGRPCNADKNYGPLYLVT